MAKTSFISVVGVKELVAVLKEFPLKIRKKVIRDSLRASAQPVLASAKAAAPVDTGNLAGSLATRIRHSKKFGVDQVQIGPGKSAAGKAFYARFIEYGFWKQQTFFSKGSFVSYAKGKGQKTWHPPRPFLRPALETNATRSVEIFRKELSDGIEAYFARAKAVGDKLAATAARAAKREMRTFKKEYRGALKLGRSMYGKKR